MNRTSRNIVHWLAVMLIVLCVTRAGLAQYSASIQGVVLDPQGALVQNATVTLVNTETNWSKTDKTNSKGIFTFNTLPPSVFVMTVEAPGFKKKVLNGIRVIPEQANAVNVKLELGQASETVNVDTAASAGLDTETAALLRPRRLPTRPTRARHLRRRRAGLGRRLPESALVHPIWIGRLVGHLYL